MKKTFKLNGLGCANCAHKMQEGIAKIEGVTQVTVNFATAKMVIVAEEEKMEAIIAQTKKLIKKIEPDVEMI